MPISDKTRKILWARSGNRCAVCRISLIVNPTEKDSDSVVGEECHIISPAPNGPRHDSNFASDKFDALDNLVLLCGTHHKMIVDQCETYSIGIVRAIKQKHETWVEAKLRDNSNNKEPVCVRRLLQNIPTKLPRISSGKDLLGIASDVCGHYFDHDQNLTEEETELVGGFVQEITDWIDVSSDFEPIDRIRFAKRIQDLLDELENQGFFVFVARETQQLEGGVGAPSAFPVLHISVLRNSNSEIQYKT